MMANEKQINRTGGNRAKGETESTPLTPFAPVQFPKQQTNEK
jgi:hypothetical protein